MNSQISWEIDEWVKAHLSKDFKFRKGQKEAITQIIDDKINNNISHHIIQAPTGSGKSLINIISAGVLWEYYDKKSYLLCSDLYLYKQYVDFIDKYKLNDFKYLKGITGNYHCSKGNCDVRNAPCKMAGLSYAKLFSLMLYDKFSDTPYISTVFKNEKEFDNCKKLFPCVKSCQYLYERLEACEAPITLMTYHLFYFQMNICHQKHDSHGKPIRGQFMYRDYIFCDECHNIPNIMQSRCRPTINCDDLHRLIKIYNYYKSLKKNPQNLKFFQKCPNVDEITQLFSKYWKDMLNTKLESYDNTILLMNYTNRIVNRINICASRIQKMFGSKILKGLTLTNKEKEIYGDITWLQNYHCYLDDFCKAIEISGFHYTYKQISKDKKTINFGTVKEDGIIFYFLLRFGIHGTTVLSATIGNVESYKENCGYKFFTPDYDKYKEIDLYTNNKSNNSVSFIDIPSNFNFDYSPIYIDSEFKLNYANKRKTIVPISQKINDILDYHYNQNGLIQTGSYEIANMIYKRISKENKNRILLYKNPSEKEKYLSYINKNTNYVLVGPSLNEGIDLPGELCEFIIVAKVPFLSLGDKYVTSKMKIFKKWYNSMAATNIIQGIGRGNRYENDHCDTYILDGCFKRLYSYTKNQFPQYVKDRFIMCNSINEAFVHANAS